MSATTTTTEAGLGAFDVTIRKSNEWFDEFMDELNWQDKYRGYLALRITLHTLRDRLPVKKAAEVGSLLPMVIRGLYYENWNPSAKPARTLNREEFLAAIREYFSDEPGVNAERVTNAVFKLIDKSVAEEGAADIREMLPDDLRELWP